MTPPTSRIRHSTAPSHWWTRWSVPLITLGLGVVLLVAEAMDGDLASGLGWLAALAVLAGLTALRGRAAGFAEDGAPFEDERDAMINTRAMAIAGIVLTVLLTSCIVFELARGNDPSPYTHLMATGGASYAIALVVLRRRS